jgi:hypothetical protein
MIKRVLIAAAVGMATTMVLIAASFSADDAGYDTLSQSLFWQNWVLQSILPTPSIESMQHPFDHGMPLPFIAWFASIPVGFVVYGVVAFIVIGKIRHRPHDPAMTRHSAP